MKYIKEGTEFLDQLKDSVHDLYDENKELKSRIDKAIEYIEDNTYKSNATEYMDLTGIRELLNILKGEDNGRND